MDKNTVDKKIKVIIMGGGVAGMSAAHELAERGFEVQVFEREEELPGGKARSVNVPDPQFPNTNPFPGEHGFRFFPGFYKHIIDTMKRIPYAGNKNGVFDNLVPAPYVMMARSGITTDKDGSPVLPAPDPSKAAARKPIVMLDRFPKSLADFRFMLKSMHQDFGLSNQDKEVFIGKIWQLMTTCRDRRVNDYEQQGWWQFVDADNQSLAYQNLLAT